MWGYKPVPQHPTAPTMLRKGTPTAEAPPCPASWSAKPCLRQTVPPAGQAPSLPLASPDLPSLPRRCPSLSYAWKRPMLSKRGYPRLTRAAPGSRSSCSLRLSTPTARSSWQTALPPLACRGLRGSSTQGLAPDRFWRTPRSFNNSERSRALTQGEEARKPQGPCIRGTRPPPSKGLGLLTRGGKSLNGLFVWRCGDPFSFW
jgi:hypothetical protein